MQCVATVHARARAAHGQRQCPKDGLGPAYASRMHRSRCSSRSVWQCPKDCLGPAYASRMHRSRCSSSSVAQLGTLLHRRSLTFPLTSTPPTFSSPPSCLSSSSHRGTSCMCRQVQRGALATIRMPTTMIWQTTAIENQRAVQRRARLAGTDRASKYKRHDITRYDITRLPGQKSTYGGDAHAVTVRELLELQEGNP